MIIKEVKATEVIDKLGEMFKSHWEEVAHYKDKIPLKVDLESIKIAEEKGKLVSVVMEEEGEIIAYAMFIVSRHLHYKILYAHNDVIFLRKDKRKTGLGRQLIEESEKILEEKGVKRITWHIKPHVDFSPILKKKGYILEEFIYGKLLGE